MPQVSELYWSQISVKMFMILMTIWILISMMKFKEVEKELKLKSYYLKLTF